MTHSSCNTFSIDYNYILGTYLPSSETNLPFLPLNDFTNQRRKTQSEHLNKPQRFLRDFLLPPLTKLIFKDWWDSVLKVFYPVRKVVVLVVVVEVVIPCDDVVDVVSRQAVLIGGKRRWRRRDVSGGGRPGVRHQLVVRPWNSLKVCYNFRF